MTRWPLVLAFALCTSGCDQVSSLTGGLIEPRWEPVDTNGSEGALHFVMNPYDMHIGLPEHVRVERTERRTITKPGGAKEQQERQRQVQVVLARCAPLSICDAKPHSQDTREVVVTPAMMGEATLYVTVAVDGKEEMKDSIKIRVAPH